MPTTGEERRTTIRDLCGGRGRGWRLTVSTALDESCSRERARVERSWVLDVVGVAERMPSVG